MTKFYNYVFSQCYSWVCTLKALKASINSGFSCCIDISSVLPCDYCRSHTWKSNKANIARKATGGRGGGVVYGSPFIHAYCICDRCIYRPYWLQTIAHKLFSSPQVSFLNLFSCLVIATVTSRFTIITHGMKKKFKSTMPF